MRPAPPVGTLAYGWRTYPDGVRGYFSLEFSGNRRVQEVTSRSGIPRGSLKNSTFCIACGREHFSHKLSSIKTHRIIAVETFSVQFQVSIFPRGRQSVTVQEVERRNQAPNH